MSRGINLKFCVALAAVFISFGALADDVGQGEAVIVAPAQGKVGTRFTLTCKDFPEPTQRDTVYVVTAGTPDVDPYAAGDVKVLWKDYAANCYRNNGHFFEKAGPFAPGNYEARFATTLYNNDNRIETATRTPFTVK